MNANAREYGFAEQMILADGLCKTKDVQNILLGYIPGACKAFKAGKENDRSGVDWWVEHNSGKFLGIDCKIRTGDYSVKDKRKDDLALEIWSVVEKQIPGWTLQESKRTDYVLWVWMDTGRWCLVPFLMLSTVFKLFKDEWRLTYQWNRQRTIGNDRDYHSECVFVPRREVWAKIYEIYSGHFGGRLEWPEELVLETPPLQGKLV